MTRLDVKVGDKVRVVNAWGDEKTYKDGDVLEVIALSKANTGSVWVRTEKPSDHGLENCDREILQPYAYLCLNEYELYEPIKVGDTVTLIDNFYEHEKFKREPRDQRKDIAKLKGRVFKFIAISILGDRAIHDTDCRWPIPLELLRKVDDGINGGWIITGMVEPKKGDPVTSFKPGKKYVYSKELNERETGPSTIGFQWHDMCDGKEVDVTSKSRGSIGSCVILPQWCYEIPTLHRHTPEQIAEAQRIIGEIVADFKFGQCYYIRDESDRELTIRYTAEEADGMHTITAHCSPHDEFNRTIGIMVALCKATGRKLPDWI